VTHYRLEEVGTTSLKLGEDEVDPLSAITGTGGGAGGTGGQIPGAVLGELLEAFNERFGADLSEEDLVKPLKHIVQRVVAHGWLAEQARANELDDFRRGKESILIDATLDVQDLSGELLQALLQRPGASPARLRRHSRGPTSSSGSSRLPEPREPHSRSRPSGTALLALGCLMAQVDVIPEVGTDDFARRFSLRAPKLMWLLGAGASAASGIPTAWDMVWEFKQRLFISQRRVSAQAVSDLSSGAVRAQLQAGPYRRLRGAAGGGRA
jgi:hypothetical protein